MIEEMTVREDVHRRIDALPEERLADVLDYLAEVQESGDSPSAETQAAIAEGLEDIRSGRTIALDEYRRTRGV